MIIKNAAFIFDLLTNKLSRSKAFETIESSNGTNSNSGLVLVQSWTAALKKIRIATNRSFFFKKKLSFLC